MSDTLSDVLRAVRLRGAVFFTIDASAPWATETPAAPALWRQGRSPGRSVSAGASPATR